MSDDESDAWAGITNGRFVAVRIDPVASVKHLRDIQATKEAGALKSGTYIGFIDCPIPWPGKQRRFVESTLLLAGIGPSSYSETRESDATKCVPIAPTTKSILGRAPVIIVGDPLPFQNCYIHSICRPDIGIIHINSNNETRSFVTLDRTRSSMPSEYSEFFTMLHEDSRRPIMTPEEAATHDPGLPHDDESKEHSAPQASPLPQSASLEVDSEVSSIASLSSEDSDTREYGSHPIEEFTTRHFLPLVHVTYDLTTVISPAPPLHFRDEYTAIRDIIYRAGDRFDALQALIDEPLDDEQAGARYKQELRAQALAEKPKAQGHTSLIHRAIDHLCIPFKRRELLTPPGSVSDAPVPSVSRPANKSYRVKIWKSLKRFTSAIICRAAPRRTTPEKPPITSSD